MASYCGGINTIISSVLDSQVWNGVISQDNLIPIGRFHIGKRWVVNFTHIAALCLVVSK